MQGARILMKFYFLLIVLYIMLIVKLFCGCLTLLLSINIIACLNLYDNVCQVTN